MVSREQAGTSLAECFRPLCHLDFGDYPPADACRAGDGLFLSFYGTFPRCRFAGPGRRRRSVEILAGAGLLQPGAQPPCGRQRDYAAFRRYVPQSVYVCDFAEGDRGVQGPYPVVDGNVFRVLSRLFAVDVPIDTSKGKKTFTELAGYLMDPQHAGEHNQAVMELGALQCVPQHPDCAVCPLNAHCTAYAAGRVADFPVKQHKMKTRNRYFHYFYIQYKGTTWITRRGKKDIWEGLYEFPLIETERPMDFAELQQTAAFRRLFDGAGDLSVSVDLSDVKHVLSHQVLYAAFYRVEIAKENRALRGFLRIPVSDIDRYAVPRLIHLYLERLERGETKEEGAV